MKYGEKFAKIVEGDKIRLYPFKEAIRLQNEEIEKINGIKDYITVAGITRKNYDIMAKNELIVLENHDPRSLFVYAGVRSDVQWLKFLIPYYAIKRVKKGAKS